MAVRSVVIRKLLDELRKIGFVLQVTTIDCFRVLFYQQDREPLALAAQQRGARIGRACAVVAAPVGRLQPIAQALVTASSPTRRSVWERCVYHPGQAH